MNTRITIILSILLIGISLIAGLIFWRQLPEQMASHWNVKDQVDGTLPRFWGVFIMPLITLVMLLLFLVLPGIDPLKENIAQFREAFNLFILLMISFMAYVYGLTLAWNLGYQEFKISAAMLPFMGVLFIAIGSLLRKAKRNFFIGIRTPWTLSSDFVWEKTHQVGAKLFLMSGVFSIIGGLVGGVWAFVLVLLPVLLTSLFLTVYSYVLYRNHVKP